MFKCLKIFIYTPNIYAQGREIVLQRNSRPSQISFGFKYFMSRGEITAVSQSYTKLSNYCLLIKLTSFKTLRSSSWVPKNMYLL